MGKPIIFVSCGQFTSAEKELGRKICDVLHSAGLEPFCAEDQHDFNGLQANILGKLREASGVVAVLHPRGDITTPTGNVTRASVWIEQELAIAAYIEHVEKRKLQVIAFRHERVSLEGLRVLLHINPTPFREDSEVLAKLPELLKRWERMKSTGISVKLTSIERRHAEGHAVGTLALFLTNDTNDSLDKYEGLMRIPSGLLRHWSSTYMNEEADTDPRYRSFRFDQQAKQHSGPHSEVKVIAFDYCVPCAIENTGESPLIGAALVSESVVEAKLWIGGREYADTKTVKELMLEAH